MVEPSGRDSKPHTADTSASPSATGLADVQASIAAAAAAARAAAAAFANGHQLLPTQHASNPTALSIQPCLLASSHPAAALSPAAASLAGILNPATAAAAAKALSGGSAAAVPSNAGTIAGASALTPSAFARKRDRSSDRGRSQPRSSRDRSISPAASDSTSRSRSRSRSSSSVRPQHRHSSKALDRRRRSGSRSPRQRSSSARRSSSLPTFKKQRVRSSSMSPLPDKAPAQGTDTCMQHRTDSAAEPGDAAVAAIATAAAGEASRDEQQAPVAATNSKSRSRGGSQSPRGSSRRSGRSRSRSRTRSRSSHSISSRDRSRSSRSRSSSRRSSSRSRGGTSRSRSSSSDRRGRRSRRRSASSSSSGRRRHRRYSRSPPLLMRGPPGAGPIYRTTRAYTFDGPPGVPPGVPPGPWGPPPLGPPGGLLPPPGFRGGRGPGWGGPGPRGVPMPPWVIESTLSHPIKRQLQFMYDVGVLAPLMLDVACIQQLEKLTDGEAAYALDELGKALSDRVRLRNPGGFFIRICQRLRSSRREREREGLGPEAWVGLGGLGGQGSDPWSSSRDIDAPGVRSSSREGRGKHLPRGEPEDRDAEGLNTDKEVLETRDGDQRDAAAAAALSDADKGHDRARAVAAVDSRTRYDPAVDEVNDKDDAEGTAASLPAHKSTAAVKAAEEVANGGSSRDEQQQQRIKPDRESFPHRDWVGYDSDGRGRPAVDGDVPPLERVPLSRGPPERERLISADRDWDYQGGSPLGHRGAAAAAGGGVVSRDFRDIDRERCPPWERPWFGHPPGFRGGSPPHHHRGSSPPHHYRPAAAAAAGISPPHRFMPYGPPPHLAAGPGRDRHGPDVMRDSTRLGPAARGRDREVYEPGGSSSSRQPPWADRDMRERDLGMRDRGAGGRGSPVYDASAPPRGAAARDSSPPHGHRGAAGISSRVSGRYPAGHRSRSPGLRGPAAAATSRYSSGRSQQQAAGDAGDLKRQRADAAGDDAMPPLPRSPPPSTAAAAAAVSGGAAAAGDAGPIISDLDALGADDNNDAVPTTLDDTYEQQQQQPYGISGWDVGHNGMSGSGGGGAAAPGGSWRYDTGQHHPQHQQQYDGGRCSQDSDDFELQPWDGSPISQDGSPISPVPLGAAAAGPAAAKYNAQAAAAAALVDADVSSYPQDGSSRNPRWQEYLPQQQQQQYHHQYYGGSSSNELRGSSHVAAGDYYSRSDTAYGGWPEQERQQQGPGRGHPAYHHHRSFADDRAAGDDAGRMHGGSRGGCPAAAAAGVVYGYGTSPGAAAGVPPAVGTSSMMARGGAGGGGAAHSDLRVAVTEVIKDILKPVWKSGKLSREAFKTVAKRATDKVLSGLPPAGAPDAPIDTAEGAAAYLSEQRRAKIRVLVNGYVQKYGSL